MSTIFSKIVSGEAPADVVYKDDLVTCFKDINPAAPVHVLIVPNKEIATLNDVQEDDKELIGHMVLTAKHIAQQNGIDERGYRLVLNCNPEGGQVVYHLHVHLLGGRPLGGVVKRV